MNDVMVDLETLGTVGGCVILSIGAVAFDRETGELGETFYRVVDKDSCVEAGLSVDWNTLAWWKQQSEEAKQVLKDAEDNGLPLADALKEFNRYLSQFENVKVWGNGADFDNAILQSAYKAVEVKQGWKFWNGRCFRTLKDLNPVVQAPERQGTHHNALDDAVFQAKHACLIFIKHNSVSQ